MDKILAKALSIEDTILVNTPSNPVVKTEHIQELEIGWEYLSSLGFNLKKSKHFNSTSAEDKATDIHLGLKDNSIKAIVAAHGGDRVQEIFEYIDWKLFKKHPKIIMGFSDITALLNAIYKMTGLVTFHGNDVRSGFGKHQSIYDKDELFYRLVYGRIGDIPQIMPRNTIQAGICEGPLLGGNMRCLLKLAGTKFMPDFSGAILLLEELNLDKDSVKLYLDSYADLGILTSISGIIIGHNYSQQDLSYNGPLLEEYILNYINKKTPVLKVDNFGHRFPQAVYPIGAKALLNATDQKITLTEEYLDITP